MRSYVTSRQMLFSLLVQRINLRLPPSSAFNFITACPVVPLPAKKSSIVMFFPSFSVISSFNKPVFFGLLKGDSFELKMLFNSVFADVVLTSIIYSVGSLLIIAVYFLLEIILLILIVVLKFFS